MLIARIVVTGAGLVAIVWVLWYFLALPSRSLPPARATRADAS